MLLRTIEVPDADGKLVNAVVLCSFTATRIDRQFLVYSLNERVGENLVKVYLTAIEGEGLALNMCSAQADMLTTAAQVLKGIIRDACAPQASQTQDTYNVLDLSESEILCSPITTHHSLKISEEWMANLLQYKPVVSDSVVANEPVRVNQGPAPTLDTKPQQGPEEMAPITDAEPQQETRQSAPAVETVSWQPIKDYRASLTSLPSPPPSADSTSEPVFYTVAPLLDSANKPAPAVTTDTAATVAPAIPLSSLTMTEQLNKPNDLTTSKKIETNLKSLMATIANHKQILSDKYLRLDERQRELEQREHLLMMKELAVVKREEELMAGIDSLQAMELHLNGLMCS